MTRNLTVCHIDTCHPCYLQDHHQRAGEHLIGVSVDGTTTYATLLEELTAEMNGTDGLPDDVTEEDVTRAVEEMAEDVTDRSEAFDSFLEEDEEDDGEGPQAWFLVTWEEDEEDEEPAG